MNRTIRENAGEAESAGLYEALVNYSESDYYPYHMPGHKRSREAGAMAQYYGIDITEIDGFDNLHHAEGILMEAQQRANKLYGNGGTETFYLVNGSTCGVLAAVMAVAEKGDEILIARNCHKAVYHAAILQELNLHYYYPDVLETYGICGGVSAEEIARLLEENPESKAVVITSPTYEGIISDIQAVAKTVHAKDKVLIVDEAHGAHLGLNGMMPPGAVAGGADLVIHSLHKTLPAMTQTALLHVQGPRVDREKLRRYLGMLQTSSPSYVLMASMDSCIRYMEVNAAERFAYMQRQYESFCKKIEKCRYIRIGSMTYNGKSMGLAEVQGGTAEEQNHAVIRPGRVAGWDIGKLVIYVQDNVLNGRQLYEILRDDYHLQMEMAAEKYVLAMMTVMDTEEGWQRLADALRQIDDRIEKEEAASGKTESAVQTAWDPEGGREDQKTQMSFHEPIVRTCARFSQNACVRDGMGTSMEPAKAYLGKKEEVPLAESTGRAAADFINLYPPGIPLIVPGEIISEGLQAQIRKSIQMGLQVQGVTSNGKITVVI